MRAHSWAFVLTLLAPSSALACGGFFCSNAAPVVQTGESVLFVIDEDRVHMHIRINYSGTARDFAWILPVPGGDDPQSVLPELSSERLFRVLDSLYAPQFIPIYEGGACSSGASGAASSGSPVEDVVTPTGMPTPDVVVHSQAPIGPYLATVVGARTLEGLTEWLTSSGYDLPAEFVSRLGPYVAPGRVFVALQLLPEANVGQIVPLRITYPGRWPLIPIVPTAIAAEDDMGLTVHVVGNAPAHSTNYVMTEIDEDDIDWPRFGSNYTRLVTAAVDDAGGRAFVTEYSGSADALASASIEGVRIPPSAILTRMFTTISPHEMTFDPVFGLHKDLGGDYDNVRTRILPSPPCPEGRRLVSPGDRDLTVSDFKPIGCSTSTSVRSWAGSLLRR